MDRNFRRRDILFIWVIEFKEQLGVRTKKLHVDLEKSHSQPDCTVDSLDLKYDLVSNMTVD